MRTCVTCQNDIPDNSVAYGPAHRPVCVKCKTRSIVKTQEAGERELHETTSFTDRKPERPLKEAELRG